MREADLLAQLGYHAALLSLAAFKDADDATLIAHCETVGARIPLVGFYLQPSVGGRVLSYDFWRRFAEIPQVVAIKIAPFNRYQTLDVVRAVVDARRDDIALYTGNDDAIVSDLVTTMRFARDGAPVERRMVGGLLGHWAVWTQGAVALLAECRAAANAAQVPAALLARGVEVTDANSAFFDAAHGFAGCIAGIQEVLRRQGLLASARCLDPHETLSAGQAAEIDRVCRAYPHLADDGFVAAHLEEWMSMLRRSAIVVVLVAASGLAASTQKPVAPGRSRLARRQDSDGRRPLQHRRGPGDPRRPVHRGRVERRRARLHRRQDTRPRRPRPDGDSRLHRHARARARCRGSGGHAAVRQPSIDRGAADLDPH